MSDKILKKVKPGDIILLHDVKPKGTGETENWLREIDVILSGLKDKGLRIVSLSELLGLAVMEREKTDGEWAPSQRHEKSR